MPRETFRILRFVLFAGVLSFFVASIFSSTTGWMLFCAALLIEKWRDFRYFARIDRWSRAPGIDIHLEGEGAWDDIFSRLYRHEKKWQRDIDKSRARTNTLRAAIEAFSDGIVLLSIKNQIVFCNAAAEKYLGLKATEDTGQLIGDLIRQPEFIAYLQKEDFEKPLSLHPERVPGTVLFIETIPYADKKKLLHIKDITTIAHLDKTRRDFVANVSHEIRTPLSVLSGFLEILFETEAGEINTAETKHYLGLMRAQAHRMEGIVQDLLTLSSIESAMPLEDRVLNMAAFITRLQKEACLLSNNQHQIRIHRDSLCDLLCSENEIFSAFMNLISNAIRYTKADGSITISWGNEGDGAVFSVEDTGIGIEEKHFPRLTERFYRVDKSRSRELGGTGLGLSIVDRVLKRHEATLDIQSTLGKGSRFSVHFSAERAVQAKRK